MAAPSGPFAELLRHDGVEEHVDLRSGFGFMAFHGGSLEHGTDAIAEAAAARSGASVYTVRLPRDLRWHIPSTRVRPEESPRLAAFLDHVDVAVAIHGYGRQGMWTSLLVGGRHRLLAGHVAHHVRAALPDYEVVSDLAAIPSGLRGVHPRNPVNRCRAQGVQLELPPRVRGMGPRWADHPPGAPVPHTASLIGALAGAAATWAPAGSPGGRAVTG